MGAQILPFPKPLAAPVSPLACFVRVGEAHKKLADLHASGYLPAQRVVIEASRFRHQRDLVTAMREAGAEIVLDTEVAELAALGKFSGKARSTPWALSDGAGPLGPDHFRSLAPSNIIGQIARFAVKSLVDVVLAPTHFLGDPACREWLEIDRAACIALRESLDREGGQGIAIDYPIIIPNTMLYDAAVRGTLLSALVDLPIENVWVRASGLGADAGPLTTQRYLMSISGLQNLGKPLIADYLGGLVGSAALAFGAVSGLAQGIGERERFDASDWHKLPVVRSEDARFGRAVRVSIPGLHRSVTLNELEVLASAKGGRRLCGCNDRTCCPHGYVDMVADPRRHAARQLFNFFSSLEGIPDLSRESHFLNGPLINADRVARQIKALRPQRSEAERCGIDIDKLTKRFHEHSLRTEKLRTTLERMHETRGGEIPRARTIAPRLSSAINVQKDRP